MEEKETIRSIKRAMLILQCFSNGKVELSIGDFARMTELSKTTIFRILTTFIETGHVLQDQATQKYRLSWKLYHLGSEIIKGMDLRTVALPLIKELCGEINETIGLNIVEGFERVCIEVEESSEPIRHFFKTGQRLPLYVGSSGRVMLAFMKDDERRQAISYAVQNELLKMDEKLFLRELDKVHQQGYAIGYDDRIIGAFSISAPIIDFSGQLVGSLIAAGPTQRWQEERIPYLIEKVVSTARGISAEIGYERKVFNK